MHGAGELGGNPSKIDGMLTTRGLYLSALGYRESQAAYIGTFCVVSVNAAFLWLHQPAPCMGT